MFDAVIEDTRFMWLADMQNQENETCGLFKKMYYTDLKCDDVQMGHHGQMGGSYDVYRLCDPNIAFWPAGEVFVNRYSDDTEICYLNSIVDQMIYSKDGNYTIWFNDIPDTGNLEGSTGTDGNYTKNY